MTSNPSSPKPNSISNSGYASAYPQTDSRTRGRVKLNSSPTSTTISDLFSPTNHHYHHNTTTTTTTNITIQNEQSTKLQNCLYYTFYSISLYLLKYSIEVTNQPINLILLFTSLTLIITPLIPSNNNFITNRLSTGTPRKLFNNPNNDNNLNHKKRHPSLNSSPPTILFTALYSLGLLILHVSFFFALSHLSVLRIIPLTCSSNQWSHSLSDLILKPFKTQQPTYIANTFEGFTIIGILSACLAIDLHFTSNSPLDSNRLVAGYLSVLTYLISQAFTQSNQHQMKVPKKSKNKRAAEILNAGIGAGIFFD
ncbi:hypothetical protein CROQUDRAFT_207738 [Cronartium quercuum f. sp. fusiforme G11]|uniref:Uncharacterized protein n=1 Tax=Cronartium quercuum f. sp. fusiforme G11 TaxID=708437 RepID=A0A9P6T9T6_9BASI|nr:hypothetical protein CROQUDRAFT_207738 [Cronartium quercuum f. sp. fusiforme G11]